MASKKKKVEATPGAGTQVLYRKWRPQSLADVAGQQHVTRTLLNALKAGRVAHAYLFCGPRGTGKTSTGRILAKAVNCTQNGDGEPCNACTLCQEITDGRAMDVMEIDAASNRGIDEIRELRERVRFSPGAAKFKVYIIDEVHMLTEAAANALLKTLEEPPPHVIFVLATTEPHKVPLTILSRCQRFDFRRISQEAMVQRLTAIATGEGIAIDEPSLRLIARSATGSMRDAINVLEQLVAHYGQQLDIEQVQAMLGITGDARIPQLVRHIVAGDVAAGLQTINGVTQDGIDLKQFSRELVEYLRGLLLVKAGAATAVDLPPEVLAEMKQMSQTASTARLTRALRLFRSVELEFDGFSPLPLELALVDSALAAGETETEEDEPPAPQRPAKPVRAARPVAQKAPDAEATTHVESKKPDTSKPATDAEATAPAEGEKPVTDAEATTPVEGEKPVTDVEDTAPVESKKATARVEDKKASTIRVKLPPMRKLPRP